MLKVYTRRSMYCSTAATAPLRDVMTEAQILGGMKTRALQYFRGKGVYIPCRVLGSGSLGTRDLGEPSRASSRTLRQYRGIVNSSEKKNTRAQESETGNSTLRATLQRETSVRSPKSPKSRGRKPSFVVQYCMTCTSDTFPFRHGTAHNGDELQQADKGPSCCRLHKTEVHTESPSQSVPQ